MVSYLQCGACMPFMVGCTFVIDQTFVLAVKEKLKISHNENDTMLESKKLHRSSYMALMNKGVDVLPTFMIRIIPRT
jgi:hypothetical protein